MKYLVVKCIELDDPYECDAYREPIYVGDNYEVYDKYGYEIYKINEDGSLTLIRHYDDVSECYMSISYWHEVFNDDEEPYKVINICEGGRDNVTVSMIKKIKQQYGFTNTIENIANSIHYGGAYYEWIGDNLIVFGEHFDGKFVL